MSLATVAATTLELRFVRDLVVTTEHYEWELVHSGGEAVNLLGAAVAGPGSTLVVNPPLFPRWARRGVPQRTPAGRCFSGGLETFCRCMER
jgi:hypothetical protein